MSQLRDEPRTQCTFVDEFIGRCTSWEGHPPDERTGASHWRSEDDAERWATGVWPRATERHFVADLHAAASKRAPGSREWFDALTDDEWLAEVRNRLDGGGAFCLGEHTIEKADEPTGGTVEFWVTCSLGGELDRFAAPFHTDDAMMRTNRVMEWHARDAARSTIERLIAKVSAS